MSIRFAFEMTLFQSDFSSGVCCISAWSKNFKLVNSSIAPRSHSERGWSTAANTVWDTARDSKGELSQQHEGGTWIFMRGLCQHSQSVCSKWKALLVHKEMALGFFGVDFTEYSYSQFLSFLMQRCFPNLHIQFATRPLCNTADSPITPRFQIPEPKYELMRIGWFKLHENTEHKTLSQEPVIKSKYPLK